MKKLTCYLLIFWLALMWGGANAHAHSVEHHAHEAHTAHAHEANTQAMTGDAGTSADASQTDNNTKNMTQGHCSHGHSHHQAAGLPSSCVVLTVAALPNVKPISNLAPASSAITNNIERPKWPITTPVVVSLLN